MLVCLAPMFVQHFLLEECLISSQTFVQQKMSAKINAPTLLDQQMLYNSVTGCRPSFTVKVETSLIWTWKGQRELSLFVLQSSLR